MFLTNIQSKKVEQILNLYKNEKKIVQFSAPTGSGKTFMLANLIADIKKFNSERENPKKQLFLIMTISMAELPKAMTEKIIEYKPWLSFDIGKVNHIKSASNESFGVDEDVILDPFSSDVMIAGSSSFKSNTTYFTRGLTESFLEEIKQKENFELIYIRDEAHYGNSHSLKEFKSFEESLENISNFTLKMSATLKELIEDQVTLSENDLKNDNLFLLKSEEKRHFGIGSDEEIEKMEELDYFERALLQFKKIKKDYEGLDINPAAIIQVKDNTKTKEKEFKETLEKVKEIIDRNNLIYSIYFSDLKETNNNSVNSNSLKSLSEKKSPVDIIIIKVGPSIGWDIPRANTLIQLRDVKSEDLNTQLLGRIRRNPMPGLEYNEITNKYYLYSSYQMPKRESASYSLQKNFINDVFFRGEITFREEEVKKIIFQDEEIKKIIKNSNESILENIDDTKEKNEIFHTLEYEESDVNKFQKGIWIKDFISLKKFLKPTLKDNQRVFEMVGKFLDENDILKKENDKLIYFYYFTKLYLHNVKKLISLKIKNEDWKSNLIFDVTLPKCYTIFKNKNNDYVSFKQYKDIYAYLNNDKREKERQFLDSIPEVKFLEKIINEIDNYYTEDSKDIEIFFKNPNQYNKLFFEYIDETLATKRKSFVDFVLKNKSKHLYIEVKSKKDYDPNKTNYIRKAFKRYAKNNNEYDIVFGLIWVEDKETNYKMDCTFFSTKNKELNTIRQALNYIME